jgi:thioredoxin 1
MGKEKQVKELVHFTAEWCVPCKQMEPIISEFIEENPDIKYTKVDVDKDKGLFEYYNNKYKVLSVPTFLGMVDGVVIDGHIGATSKFILKSLLG